MAMKYIINDLTLYACNPRAIHDLSGQPMYVGLIRIIHSKHTSCHVSLFPLGVFLPKVSVILSRFKKWRKRNRCGESCREYFKFSENLSILICSKEIELLFSRSETITTETYFLRKWYSFLYNCKV